MDDDTIAEAKDAFSESKRKRDGKKDEKVLQHAREEFDEAVDAESENRRDALDDIRFARLGEQWHDKDLRDRQQSGRPCLTINRQPAFIRQVVNDARQNRPQIRVKPVDSGSDRHTAEVMSGLIRNIEYSSGADVAYDNALECAVDGGFGYVCVDLDYASDDVFDMDLMIRRVANRFTIYGDPRSEAADTSDWDVAFETRLLSLSAFNRQYKGADPVSWEGADDGYSELKAPWRDGDDVLVAAYWTREYVPGTIILLRSLDGTEQIVDGDVFQKQRQLLEAAGLQVAGTRKIRRPKVKKRILTGAEVLEEDDWPGIYIPISVCYGDEVNVEGRRYLRSLIRDAKDAQRMFNYWRTTTTELVALAPKAPWVGEEGTFTDPNWRTANRANHPFLTYKKGSPPPIRQPFDGVPAGALQEALNASDDMKAILGIYDASLGARSNETSGRAIMARQREGDVSTFHFIDNLGRCIRHVGRILIDLIPKVYTSGRMVRVLGVDGTPQNVQLGPPPPGAPMPQVQLPSGQIASQVFDLTAGKYDLTVETGPSFTTRRQEAAAEMVEFVRAYPNVLPLIGDLLVKALDWPGAEEVGERLKAMLPPQLQGQNPQLQQAQAQMQEMDRQAREAVGELQKQLAALQQQLQQAQTAAEKQAITNQAAQLDKEIDNRKLMIDFYGKVTDRLQNGLPTLAGAENDPELAAIAGQAAQQQQATHADAAMRSEQASQTIVQAVQALSQLVAQLSQPRDVVRDDNGLIVRH